MAAAFVPAVEPQRVDAVQPLHAAREVRDGRRDDEVVVRRHQAVGVDVPAEALDAVGQQREERPPVDAVAVDRCVVDAERRDVEDAVGQKCTKRARHAANVTRGVAPFPRREAIVTLLLRQPCLVPTSRRV
jgi:hypothetical protein